MLKKSLVFITLLVFLSPLIKAADEGTVEVSCSTDSVFSQYSCNQCFNGGARGVGQYVGFLEDVWKNTSGVSRWTMKEVQDLPKMYALTSNVSWSQTPDSPEEFWGYTSEFEALASSEDDDIYILGAGKEVPWIRSNTASAYKLDRNGEPKDTNIGLLVYTFVSAPVLEDGSISEELDHHVECVLYKSGDEIKAPAVVPKLPKTGPAEYFLLLILAMVLGFGILKFRGSKE